MTREVLTHLASAD